MRQIYSFTIILITILIITGCGANAENMEPKQLTIEEVADKLERDERIKDFITYTETEIIGDAEENILGTDWYKITVRVNEEFDNLSSKEQSDYFITVADVIEEYDDGPQFACRENVKCRIQKLEIKTQYNVYTKGLLSSVETAPLEKNDEIIYEHEVVGEPKKQMEYDKEENVEELKEDRLSEDFLAYNNEYYSLFYNYNDLIGSNFQLITDNQASSLLIEDLIMWSNEFNELLDVYQTNAEAVNDLDKELYELTTKMNASQKLANDYTIKGLENLDNQSLIIASGYLEEAYNLYIKGKEMLE